MTRHSLDSLLAPVDGDNPVGEDLEYDADFLELGRAAAPKAERAIGDTVKAAEEPDWPEVAALAEPLLARSKDLRIAIHLCNAWMGMEGLSGFTSGLALVRGLLETFWDGVHPQLDAEDDNDPTFRVNSIAPLTDSFASLQYLRNAIFIQSPRLGRFSLRDLRIADGTLTPTGEAANATSASLAEIEGCCMDCEEEVLVAAAAAAATAFDHAQAIGAIFDERVGAAGPDLKLLFGDLSELKTFLSAQRDKRMPPAVDDDADSVEQVAPTGAEAGSGAVAARSGVIAGSQDVVRRLDELCQYYQKSEPSSPVPILLRRAQRLVGMGFEDVLKDLAPGGLSELQVIAGGSGDPTE